MDRATQLREKELQQDLAEILRQAGWVVIPPNKDAKRSAEALREQAIALLTCSESESDEIRRLLGWGLTGDGLATRVINALPIFAYSIIRRKESRYAPEHPAEYKSSQNLYFWVILCRGRMEDFEHTKNVGPDTAKHLQEALHRLGLDFGIPEDHELVLEARRLLNDDRLTTI